MHGPTLEEIKDFSNMIFYLLKNRNGAFRQTGCHKHHNRKILEYKTIFNYFVN